MNKTTWHDIKKELPTKEGKYLVCRKLKFGQNDIQTIYAIGDFKCIFFEPGFYKYSVLYGFMVDDDIVAWAEFDEYTKESEGDAIDIE